VSVCSAAFCIGAISDLWPDAKDRSEKDDPREELAVRALAHQGNRLAGAQPRSAGIDVIELVEVFRRHIGERADLQRAGGADQRVDVTEARSDALERRIDGIDVTDIFAVDSPIPEAAPVTTTILSIGCAGC
jgi:hypothetical protein